MEVKNVDVGVQNETPNYYAIITAEVRYDNRLSANAKLLYGEISALTHTNGLCWASDNYFSELYNVSRSTLQRWLKQLEDFGYIERIVIYKTGTKLIEKRYIRVYANLGIPYTQKRDNPIPKNETVITTSIITTSINNRESNNSNIIDVVDNSNPVEEISLLDVNNLALDLKIDKSTSEKFYHYYSVRDFKTKDNLIINKDNLKNHLLLWASREYEKSVKNTDDKSKVNKPEFLNEFLNEIKEMDN